MQARVDYEWWAEEWFVKVAEDGEIELLQYKDDSGVAFDSCILPEEAVYFNDGVAMQEQVVLVRKFDRYGDGDWCSSDTSYAYIENRKLPDHFDDGKKIPKYLHAEVAARAARAARYEISRASKEVTA